MVSKKTSIPYKRNFLDKVILRLDFESVDLKKLSTFSKEIQDEFPFQEQKDGQTGAMKLDLLKGTIIENDRQLFKEWEFLNASKKKKLVVSPTHVYLEYNDRSYSDKTELLKDYDSVVAPFLNKFGINTINRIGLRYINNFNFNEIKKDFDWKKMFASELLGGISLASKNKSKVARSMGQLEVKLEAEDVRFVYGLWNMDYPNENTRKEFVMDFDCFSRFPISQDSDVKEVIRRFNLNIQELFEKGIKEDLREFLRKKK